MTTNSLTRRTFLGMAATASVALLAGSSYPNKGSSVADTQSFTLQIPGPLEGGFTSLEYFVTDNGVLTDMRGKVSNGSGVTYCLTLNGVPLTTSAATSTSSVFTRINQQVSRGDRIAVQVVNSGTSARTLKVTANKTVEPTPVDTSKVYVANYSSPQAAADVASGKTLVFPAAKSYTVLNLSIPSDCHVDGNGSSLKFADNSTTGSESDAILLMAGNNITIDGLNFNGNWPAQNQANWTQHRHCIRAVGNYSNGSIMGCTFSNIIGDGVYLNVAQSGQSGANWLVDNCTFLGNHENRNGVSIISGTNMRVQGCYFSKMTRTGMPGAIDIEPNSSTDTITQVYVENNTIYGGDTGVSGWQNGIQSYNGALASMSDIYIRNNEIYGSALDAGIAFIGKNGGAFYAPPSVYLDNNNIHDLHAGSLGIEIDYWTKVTSISNNTFNTMNYAIYNYLACTTGTTITGNTYTNVTNGSTIGVDTPHCS